MSSISKNGQITNVNLVFSSSLSLSASLFGFFVSWPNENHHCRMCVTFSDFTLSHSLRNLYVVLFDRLSLKINCESHSAIIDSPMHTNIVVIESEGMRANETTEIYGREELK